MQQIIPLILTRKNFINVTTDFIKMISECSSMNQLTKDLAVISINTCDTYLRCPFCLLRTSKFCRRCYKTFFLDFPQ